MTRPAFLRTLAFISISALITACGGSGSSSSDSSGSSSSGSTGTTSSANSASAAFPSEVVVASPVDSDTTAFTGRALAPTLKNAKKLIAELMDGDATLSATLLSPDNLLREPGRANCYGPAMKYKDHPDGATPNSGELPGEIWVSGQTPKAPRLKPALQPSSTHA
ncbi:hypothetical protein AAIA72_15685 [Hahella sp. SMD15-11]|uniref:Uncharacterized protein n=1 Tax=Thermohahella caldifontis TaxID=3142973 RepID=A0AB39UVA2_9GAMM